LSFTQGIRQFHDAKLLAGRTQNDPDFAGANPTVYTKLLLQIKSSSWPAKRECTATPYFFSIAISRAHLREFQNTLTPPRLR
jgi:hypothetical protein